jgi:predicted phosphoadenosine phosphosulfate sulfurtransferase
LKSYSLTENVLEAAVRRLEEIYTSFSQVYISVSFGKDSTVMLNLAIEVARRLGKLPVHVLYVDLEGQYQTTINLAHSTFNRSEVTGHWVCLPLNLRNAVSVHEPFWRCWDPQVRDRWVRPLPIHSSVVSDQDFFPFYRFGMEFEEFVQAYGEWFAGEADTACLVGIRTDESLNRFRTIASPTKRRFKELSWTTQSTRNVYSAYPLYDWKVEDIWTAVGRYKWEYNRIYDLMQMAGTPLSNQRICQPYGDDQRRGLDLFHRCEPETWVKIVGRVAGANFGATHAKSALMGFRSMTKPHGHTWRSYAEFLLETLPRFQAEWYHIKFRKFFSWWEKNGFPIENIPDEADPEMETNRKIPSWRRICRCIVTNDLLCRGLSFDQTTRQWEKYMCLKEEFGE